MGKHWVPDELDRTMVSTHAKDLYRALCRRAGKTSRWSGSKKQLAKSITASVRTVHNALVELRELSMASWRRSDLESGVSIYMVLPPERWEPEAFAVPTGMRRGRAKDADRHHVPTGTGQVSEVVDAVPGKDRGGAGLLPGADRHLVPTADRHHVPTLGSTSCRSTPGSTDAAAGAAALLPADAVLRTATASQRTGIVVLKDRAQELMDAGPRLSAAQAEGLAAREATS